MPDASETAQNPPASLSPAGPVTLDARCIARLRSLHPGPLREDAPLLAAGQILGRDGDQADLIQAGPDVSRRHAWIGRDEQGKHWTIRDLDSLNGTYVNGQPVNGSQRLQSGDVIGLGRSRAPDYEFALSDAALERDVQLNGSGPWTIGRGLDQTISLPADLSVSHLHARIERQGRQLRVIDLGSRNGLWQGAHRTRRLILRPGDSCMIGHHRLVRRRENATAIKLELSSLGQAIGLRLEGWQPTDRPDTTRLDLAPGQMHRLRIHDRSHRRALLRCVGRDHLIDGDCLSHDWLSDQVDRQRDRVAFVDGQDPLPERVRLTEWLREEACLRIGSDLTEDDGTKLIATTLEALGLQGKAEVRIADLTRIERALARLSAALLTRPGLVLLDCGELGLDTDASLDRLERLAGAELTLVMLSPVDGLAVAPVPSAPPAPGPAAGHLRRPAGRVIACLLRRSLRALTQQTGAQTSLFALPIGLTLILVLGLSAQSAVLATQIVLLISTPLAALALWPTLAAVPREFMHRSGLLPDLVITQTLLASATLTLQFLLVLTLTTALLPLDVWTANAGGRVWLSGAAGMALGLALRTVAAPDRQLRALILTVTASTVQSAWILSAQPGLVALALVTLLWAGLALLRAVRSSRSVMQESRPPAASDGT